MELGAGAGPDSQSHTSTPLDLTLSYHLPLLLPPLLPSLGSLPPHPAHSLRSLHALRLLPRLPLCRRLVPLPPHLREQSVACQWRMCRS